jgi:bifunctional DNA-binding transcriptional regulator/antitoxin component of YhaV-PrlF toxin-antitoxin module
MLPFELRWTTGIQERDLLEIFTEGYHIILRKYEPDACSAVRLRTCGSFGGDGVFGVSR